MSDATDIYIYISISLSFYVFVCMYIHRGTTGQHYPNIKYINSKLVCISLLDKHLVTLISVQPIRSWDCVAPDARHLIFILCSSYTYDTHIDKRIETLFDCDGQDWGLEQGAFRYTCLLPLLPSHRPRPVREPWLQPRRRRRPINAEDPMDVSFGTRQVASTRPSMDIQGKRSFLIWFAWFRLSTGSARPFRSERCRW